MTLSRHSSYRHTTNLQVQTPQWASKEFRTPCLQRKSLRYLPIPRSVRYDLTWSCVKFNKPYKIHSVPTPSSLGPNELLLKVAVASLCHTDGMVTEGRMGTQLPCIASHEGTGTVVATGAAVQEFKKGDRVMAGLPRDRCGHCTDCLGPDKLKHYCNKIKGYVGCHLGWSVRGIHGR